MLGIDPDLSVSYADAMEAGCGVVRPGWFRINFNYFISETVFEYVVGAVHLLASEGWKLLPLYRFDPVTGLWQHRSGAAEEPPRLRDAPCILAISA